MKVGLECFVGLLRIAIPVEAVDQIIEYELTSPLPLARDFIGGLGIHAHRVIVSVELMKSEEDRRSLGDQARVRTAKGVLLDTKGSDIAWALEVAHVASFVEVESAASSVFQGPAAPPPWIAGATARNDGRVLGWVDVNAMVAALSKGSGGQAA